MGDLATWLNEATTISNDLPASISLIFIVSLPLIVAYIIFFRAAQGSSSTAHDAECRFALDYKLWVEGELTPPSRFNVHIMDAGYEWNIETPLVSPGSNVYVASSTSPHLNVSSSLVSILSQPIKHPIPSKHFGLSPVELAKPNASNIRIYPYSFNTLIDHIVGIEPPADNTSEASYHHLVDSILIGSLKLLSSLESNDPFRVDIYHDRDTNYNDIHSMSTTVKKNLRPDSIIYFAGCAFIVGEERRSVKQQSPGEVIEKLLPFSPYLYGKLPFLISYCSSGTKFRYFAISPHPTNRYKYSPPIIISPEYDLKRTNERLDLMLFTFKLYMLYKSFMVRRVTPSLTKICMGMLPHKPHVSVYNTMVVKYSNDVASDLVYTRINRLSSFTLEAAKSLSSIEETDGEYTDDNNGLVESSLQKVYITRTIKHRLSKPHIINEKYYRYQLSISPVAFCDAAAVLDSLAMLKSLCTHVGNALIALHSSNIVHCDLRKENIWYYGDGIFILGDFECAIESNTHQHLHLAKHPPAWAHGKPWIPEYDVYLFRGVIADFLGSLDHAKESKSLLALNKQSQYKYKDIKSIQNFVNAIVNK